MQPVMKNMTIKQLRYVEAAARHSSIAAAALECNISQSSIVNAIDALEHELSFDLFLREPSKGIKTTPAGSLALSKIQNFLGAARLTETELASIGNEKAGRIYIGCSGHSNNTFLNQLIRRFSAAYPEIKMVIIDSPPDEIMKNLESGKIDIAICYDDACRGKWFIPLFSVEPVIILSNTHKLSNKTYIAPVELTDSPIILLSGATQLNDIKKMTSMTNIDPEIYHHVSSHQLAISLIEAEQGYLLTRSDFLLDEVSSENCVKLPIILGRNEHALGLARNNGETSRKTVQIFVKFCENLAAENWFSQSLLQTKY